MPVDAIVRDPDGRYRVYGQIQGRLAICGTCETYEDAVHSWCAYQWTTHQRLPEFHEAPAVIVAPPYVTCDRCGVVSGTPPHWWLGIGLAPTQAWRCPPCLGGSSSWQPVPLAVPAATAEQLLAETLERLQRVADAARVAARQRDEEAP